MKNVVSHVPQAGRAQAEKGIIAPKYELLELGQYLYRFASDTAGLGYQAGPWWIKQHDFEGIVERADRRGMDLGQKARWDLAILQKWGSKMNVVVEAQVTSKLWAWVGLAKPQSEENPNNQIIRMYGHRSIRQLYLPTVTDRSGMLTAQGREGLSVTGAKVIPSSSIY